MSRKVIITCAVTGGGSAILEKHPLLPKTPKEIAASALEAAKAGAAIVHLHVRDPLTGAPSNSFQLYEEVVKIIRDSGQDVVLNLTCGMDGTIALNHLDRLAISPASTLKAPLERCYHALELRPEIATLDCGTMAFGEHIFVARMSDLREMASLLRQAGVKPELECFELGHIETAKALITETVISSPPLFQLCLGTGYGAPATPSVIQAMKDCLPPDAIWGGFGCGRDEMPIVAQIAAQGGHVRVGLEDNIYMRKGILATNADLVNAAARIIEKMGYQVATAGEARQLLGLKQSAEKQTL